ncbi:MAG: DUF6338 family protein [Elusimicrobiales bacterium]|nr:DUF6338 family protein [Elusimicrobiales bacterium]
MDIVSVLKACLSAVFLIPGYLVVCFRALTRERGKFDSFEMMLQCLVWSLAIGLSWLYLTPTGDLVRFTIVYDKLQLEHLIVSFSFVIQVVLQVFFLTVIMCAVCVLIDKYRFTALCAIGLGRMSPYLTPWERTLDLSAVGWVIVNTKSKIRYVGVIMSGSHYPYERSIILRGTKTDKISVYDLNSERNAYGDYIWLAGDEILSIEVLPKGKAA